MTRPIVTETTQAMQPVDRDTFLDAVDRPVAAAGSAAQQRPRS